MCAFLILGWFVSMLNSFVAMARNCFGDVSGRVLADESEKRLKETRGFFLPCGRNVVSVRMFCFLMIRVEDFVNSFLLLVFRVVGDALVYCLTVLIARFSSVTAIC